MDCQKVFLCPIYFWEASSSKALAPNPYTVSVGKATKPPFSEQKLPLVNLLIYIDLHLALLKLSPYVYPRNRYSTLYHAIHMKSTQHKYKPILTLVKHYISFSLMYCIIPNVLPKPFYS